MKIIDILYYTGAVLLLAGAAARLFVPGSFALIYMPGAVLFSLMQFILRPRSKVLAVRRLVMQQQLAGILFIAAGVLMFTHNHNEWMPILTCGAMVELYTAFRLPRELEKEKN